jgi:hypothetical protein
VLALAARDEFFSATIPGVAPRRPVQGVFPLRRLMPPNDKALAQARDKALAWLESVEPGQPGAARGTIYEGKPTGNPDTLNERLVLRLLVARKFGKPGNADQILKELLARQAADGGWSANPEVHQPSDAFATGQSLYALCLAGSGDEKVKAAVERACKFLVAKQEKDGSWLVPTTAFHTPSTKPGRDKRTDPVYAYWGTAWATLGLLHTLPAESPERKPQDRPATTGRLLFSRQGHLTLIGPDGKDEKQVSKDRDKFMPSSAWLSPDGKRVACLIQVGIEPIEGVGSRYKVYVRGLDEPEPGTDLNIEGGLAEVMWSPDGSQFIVSEFISAADPKAGRAPKIINWLVNVKTKEKSALRFQDNHAVTDWSRDGKHFLTMAYGVQKEKRTWRLYLMNRDGTEAKALTDGSSPVGGGRLSPDGQKVLCQLPDPDRKGMEGRANLGLFVLDVKSGKSLRVEGQPLNGEFMGYCWSPDGKRIAYAWRQVLEKEDTKQETESNLIVADADGKNPVTIASEKGDSSGLITISGVDWR